MTEKEFLALQYKKVYIPDHPFCYKHGTVYKHRLKVEKAIGRYLEPTEEVHHHYNADSSVTLILCQDIHYHRLLHLREEAIRYCGYASWRKCKFCKEYDDLKNMSNNTKGTYHKKCNNTHMFQYKQNMR